MLIANLILGNVSAIHISFLISGSDASCGPAYVSIVQSVEAPL
jgi:hypothetical protein